MRTQHSFAINFILRRSDVYPEKAGVYCRITVDGQVRELSLKQIILFDDWSHHKEQLRGKGLQAKALNEMVEHMRYKIRVKYRELLENDELVTAETVKQAYLGVQAKPKGHRMLELLEYYEKIWRDKLKWGGFKNYLTTIDYIKRFIQFKFPSGDMFLSEFNMEAATEFEYFIRNNPSKLHDPCDGNGLSKHIQRLKRILNWAVEIEWIAANPIEKYSRPMKRAKRKKLSMEEIFALERKDFAEERLAYVKDLFLFSIYTGLAYVDVMALTPDAFNWDQDGTAWCKVYRVKSDGLCHIPLLSPAIEILRKYQPISKAAGLKTLFPHRTNQHINWCLTVIKEACEIETPMTFHIARHTFAKTVALKNGVPLETIQMVLGHTKIATTQIYADVDEEKILKDMSLIEGQMAEKRQIDIRRLTDRQRGI